MPALQTAQDMSAQGGGTASGQVVEGAALHGRQARTVPFQECIATAPEDLGHFEPRSVHGWVLPPGEVSSPSNGLRVDFSAAVVMWR